MYKLLTNVWKIESEFAIALIDIYGGHIWDVYQALMSLKEDKKDFKFLNPSLTTSVQKCYDCKFDDFEDHNRMIKSLEQLAKEGFCPLESRDDDPIGKVISNYGVGGIVSSKSIVIGLDMKVWEKYPDCKYGIVPSKQSMRLAIAEYIVYKENKKVVKQ